MSRKKVVLEPNFPRKISTEERVWVAIRDGARTYREISHVVQLKSGGHLSNTVNMLIAKKLVRTRKCECGMHDMFELAK